MIICYQGPSQSVVGFASVVAQGVDHPPNKPEESEGGGHLGVEQPGGQQNGQEDWDTLQGVLVNSLRI